MEVPTTPHRTSRESRAALFVTFYSFKGGVGRTLAMLNVACILAGLGRRVLMIDFDLEAPGLTLFQEKQRDAGVSQEQPGLVDAITDFLDDPSGSPLGDADPSQFFEKYVAGLKIPAGVRKREEGCLDLVPAGRLDADYESRMYGLAFDEMFEEGVGRPLFNRLKNVIRDADRYDYVLVDSRTGFSDEGSICTRFLGDYLVVLTGLNRQNVIGTARFLRQSNIAERDEPLALVASPVPMYYEDLRAERIDSAKTRIAERAGLDEVRFIAQIPYHPLLALEEDPTVRNLEGTDLFEAYEKITETLRDWAGDQPEERMQQAFYLLGRGEIDKSIAAIEEVKQEDPQLALRMLRSEASFLVSQEPEHAVAALQKGRAIAHEVGDPESEGKLLRYIGNAKYNLGELDESIHRYEEALSITRKISDRHSEKIILDNVGRAYRDLGRPEKAIDYFEEALAISREVTDRHGEGMILHDLGNATIDLGRVKEAIVYYEEALAISREVDSQRDEGIALFSIGRVNHDLGDVETALGLYRETLSISRKVDSRHDEGIAIGGIGHAHLDLGRVEEAIDHYERSLTIFREVENRRREISVLSYLGLAYAQTDRESETTEVLEEARCIMELISHPPQKVLIHLNEARSLTHFQPERAHEILSESWPFVMNHATAFERAGAFVLRARLRLEVEDDAEGAAEDAQTALDFYRPRDVDSRWSREAEEILEKAKPQPN